MAKTSYYMTMLQKEKDASFMHGMEVGAQFMVDCWMVTLNDPDVMGRDVFGKERMKRVAKAVEANYDKYLPAFNVSKNKEADVWQDRLDEKLEKIFKDELDPFPVRHPLIRKIKY